MVENLHGIAGNIHLVSDAQLTADPAIIERINRFVNLKTYEGYKVNEFAGESTLSHIKLRKKATEDVQVTAISKTGAEEVTRHLSQ